jgi:hypothetical protein
MATERIKITPDYIIAKNSAGTVTYSAGTPPTGGATTFPPYLRSSSTSSINTDYDIYYNQVAPLPYPELNTYNVSLNEVSGSIFSLTAAPVNSTTTVVSTTLVEPGTYVIVPTVWYIESPGITSDINTTAYIYPASTTQFKYEVKIDGVVAYTFFVSRYQTDTKTLWIGPTDQVGAVDPDTDYYTPPNAYSVKINYGMTNPDSTSITNPASYISDTYSTKTLSITPVANGQTVPSGCTLGTVKILYYSRGYLGMRYTK